MAVMRNEIVRNHLKCLYSHQLKCLVYDAHQYYGLDMNREADHYV